MMSCSTCGQPLRAIRVWITPTRARRAHACDHCRAVQLLPAAIGAESHDRTKVAELRRLPTLIAGGMPPSRN
jgi:hypothetical protein